MREKTQEDVAERQAKNIKNLKGKIKKMSHAVAGMHKIIMDHRIHFSTEKCPECGAENEFKWNVLKNGYVSYCQHCGSKMMLCSECLADGDMCDWNEEEGCYRAKKPTECWYEERWYREDIENTLAVAGIPITEENITRLWMKAKKIFDDKSDRNEMLVMAALEEFEERKE